LLAIIWARFVSQRRGTQIVLKDKGNNKSSARNLQQEEVETVIEQEDEGKQITGSSESYIYIPYRGTAAISLAKSVCIQCRSVQSLRDVQANGESAGQVP
jgi:hypothetical protein